MKVFYVLSVEKSEFGGIYNQGFQQGYEQAETGSREQGAGSREQGAESREQGAERNKELKIHSDSYADRNQKKSFEYFFLKSGNCCYFARTK